MKVTASKTALWVNHCAWWARPEVPQDLDRPNEYRNFGLAVHDALEVLRLGGSPDLVAIAGARELTAAQRLAFPRAVDALQEYRVPLFAESELAWAIDLDMGMGRVLGRNIGRAYKEHGARDGIDFCGSADLVWWGTSTAHREYIHVLDLKSGYEGLVEDHKPQLMSNAAGIASAWGARGAILEVLHLFNGEVKIDTQIVEDYELEAHIGVLQARRRETPNATPVPGPHCSEKYCTAVGSCPEGQRAIAALVPVDRLTVKLTGAIESAAEAAARVAILPLLKERVKRYEDECRDWERAHGPVQLADGRWWYEVEGESRAIVASAAAMAVLADELGDVGAQLACAVKITQSSIRAQLEAAGIAPASAALERIMLRLEKVGAMKSTPRYEHDFRKFPPRTRGAA